MSFPEFKYFPDSLDFTITRNCTLNCEHCMVGNLLPKENMDYSFFTKTIFEYEQILKEQSKNEKQKKPAIILWGGEPTLHPEFKKFVEFAAKHSEIVLIDTNLTVMPIRESDLINKFEYLKKHKNIRFMISFDDFHLSQLNNSALEKYELKLLNFLKFTINNNINCEFNTIGTINTLKKFKNKELIKLLKDISTNKPKNIIFTKNTIINTGKAKKLNVSKIYYPTRLVHDIYHKNPSLVINSDGQVFYGGEEIFLESLNKNNFRYAGNLYKESLLSVISKIRRQKLIRSVKEIKRLHKKGKISFENRSKPEQAWIEKWFNNPEARRNYTRRKLKEIRKRLGQHVKG